MTVHLLKMAVGCDDVDELAARQAARRKSVGGRPVVLGYTRRWPRRVDELVDGGSIYWIVKRAIRARQRIVDLVEAVDPDGTPYCQLQLDPELVATEAAPRRPMQGWRYLVPQDAPRDRGPAGEGEEDLPAELQEELRELGLL
jgi:hypothetical protein